MYYITEQEAYGIHIGIVRSVNDESGDGEIGLDEVRIVESRYSRAGVYVSWVTMDRTLADLAGRHWRVVRLRTEE